MKQIEVTDEMYEALIEISTNMNNQDSRCTASPYFYQVQCKKEVAAYEGCGDIIWHHPYSSETLRTDEDIKEYILNELFENDEEFGDFSDEEAQKMSIEKYNLMDKYDIQDYLENKDWNKYDVQEESVYENMFFTEKACEEHIRINKHNMNKPQSYVQHAYRNPELELIVKFLKGLSK